MERSSAPWVDDPKFATITDRKRHEDELETHISEWTSTLEAEDVMHRLRSAGVPAGVVQDARDLMENDPQLKERGFSGIYGTSGPRGMQSSNATL